MQPVPRPRQVLPSSSEKPGCGASLMPLSLPSVSYLKVTLWL